MSKDSRVVSGHSVAVVSQAVLLDAPGFVALRTEGVQFVPVTANGDHSARIDLLKGHVAVVAGPELYSREIMAQLPALRLISRSGVGHDAIDVAAAANLGIHVTVTSGVNARGVAEHTLALLLAQLHRVPEYDARVRRGLWRDGVFFRELRGSHVGVVGFGQIGRCFAELLQPFGVVIHAYDPMLAPTAVPQGVRLHDSLADMLPVCDVLSLHVPLTGATHHLIGPAEIALLPRGAVIVNTARGPVIDEGALVAALASGHVGGAVLDVFDVEPVRAGEPVLSAPNTVLSPHISSFGLATIRAMSDRVADQIGAVLRGESPDGEVTRIGAVASPR